MTPVHEVDVTRFLFDEEIVSIQIITPSATECPEGADPQSPSCGPPLASMSTSNCRQPPASPRGAHRGCLPEKGSAMIGWTSA